MSSRTRASSPGGVIDLFSRVLDNNKFASASSEAFANVGRVYLCPIEVPFRVTIDRIGYAVGAAVAGNVRQGLYARGVEAFPDLPDGGVLLAESASEAQPGTNRIQWFTVPAVQLDAGLYFSGIQADDIAATFYRQVRYDSWNPLAGLTYPSMYYDHGYGPFTNPCPATTLSPRFYFAYLWVISIP